MRPAPLDGRRAVAAWRRLLREEEGVVLVLAVLIMLVLTLALTTVIALTDAVARAPPRSNAGHKGSALADAGINHGLGVL